MLHSGAERSEEQSAQVFIMLYLILQHIATETTAGFTWGLISEPQRELDCCEWLPVVVHVSGGGLGGQRASVPEDEVDADDTLRLRVLAAVNDRGLSLHPHEAPSFGQHAVLACAHLPLDKH